MNAQRGRLTLAAIATALAMTPNTAGADKVKMQHLGTLERAFSSATAVLPDGTILGQVANPNNDREQAFLYSGGQRIHLSLGGKFSVANYDEASGLITGQATLHGESEVHPFFVDNFAAIDMGTLGGSEAYIQGWSANGRYIVGFSYLPGNVETRAFRYDTQTRTMEELGNAGGADAFAYLAANDGRAIGSARTADNRTVAFLQDAGGFHELSFENGNSEARFTPIGEHVVGVADFMDANGQRRSHAFAYGPQGLKELSFGGHFGAVSTVDSNSGTNGNVVGYESFGVNEFRAFLYNLPADRFQELVPPGAVAAMALAQTSEGKVVGRYRTADGVWRAFIYDIAADSYRTVGLGGDSWINGWNSAGQFVGGSFLADGSVFRAYVYDWNTDTISAIGTLGGDNNDAHEISEDGRVLGASNTSGGSGSVAFLLDGSGMHPLSLGGDFSSAMFINDGSLIIGSASLASGMGDHAFEYDAGGMHEITLGGSQSIIRFSNRSGNLVGSATAAGDQSFRAFYYDSASNVTLDFGTLGGSNTFPSGINESGVMAGNSQTGAGNNYHAFLATVGADDEGAPTISYSLSAAANGAGWHKDDVTVTLMASDEADGSGLKEIAYSASGAQVIAATTVSSSPVEVVISAEGETTITFSATDNAGNASAAQSVTIKLDKTAPVIDVAPASSEWSRDDLAIAASASDALSGLANSADASFTLTTSVDEGSETDTASTNSRMVHDIAGNSAMAGPVTGLKVDKKAPVITVTAPSGGSYLLNEAVNASFLVVDGGSGVDTVSSSSPNGGPLDTATVGVKTFSVSAADRVGNKAMPVTVSYSVSFGVKLLYDPTRAVRSGAAYPIKLQLVDGGGLNVSSQAVSVHAMSVRKTSDSTSEVVDDTGNANEDSDFRFDAGLGGSPGGYIFNLSTRGLSSGTYEIVFTAGADPKEHTAQFRVR